MLRFVCVEFFFQAEDGIRGLVRSRGLGDVYKRQVYTCDPAAPFRHEEGLHLPDVAILNTNSRLDPAGLAYDKVQAATRQLQAAGCRQFFNKTCSVFRGNIGAEFDSMLDALEQEFALVVLGFPRNGRLTIDGVHYVHGVRLEESEFRNDPVHPMTHSNLVDILGSQTRRRVARIGHDVVERGPAALRREIAALRSRCNYLILDVADQAALATIARAAGDYPVLCGSSALAEELPQLVPQGPLGLRAVYQLRHRIHGEGRQREERKSKGATHRRLQAGLRPASGPDRSIGIVPRHPVALPALVLPALALGS